MAGCAAWFAMSNRGTKYFPEIPSSVFLSANAPVLTAAVAHAMNDAIERALKDGKFTQNEAKQFQNAQNLINGAIQDHKLDAHDAQIVIKVLDKIAPEKGNGR